MNKKEYIKKWQKENKDKLNEYQKQYKEKNKEKAKEWQKKSYYSHKEERLEYSKEYYEDHKKRHNENIHRRRKEVALIRQQKGAYYTYLSKTEYEMKNINKVIKCNKVNEDRARELLIENDWNTRRIVELNLK